MEGGLGECEGRSVSKWNGRWLVGVRENEGGFWGGNGVGLGGGMDVGALPGLISVGRLHRRVEDRYASGWSTHGL